VTRCHAAADRDHRAEHHADTERSGVFEDREIDGVFPRVDSLAGDAPAGASEFPTRPA